MAFNQNQRNTIKKKIREFFQCEKVSGKEPYIPHRDPIILLYKDVGDFWKLTIAYDSDRNKLKTLLHFLANETDALKAERYANKELEKILKNIYKGEKNE